MDPTFWHHKWQSNDIGFHESEANAMLVRHFAALGLDKGSRVLLPLCGKTLDISWLLAQGYCVAGVELSELAVEQLFEQLGVEPKIIQLGALKHYSHSSIDVYVGDIFALSAEVLGDVDGIYDRAALVALPDDLRGRYTQHLLTLSNNAPQLLICFDYDQSLLPGPPFAIDSDEVQRHYRGHYAIKQLENTEVIGGLKGQCAAHENAWLLARF